jgi:uncharacterized protein (DUF433 family)
VRRTRLKLVSSKRQTIETHMDVREKPIYTLDEAARYLTIPPTTLATWALGRTKTAVQEAYTPTLEHVDQRLRLLSFYDLVEAHILRAAIERNLPLQRIKRGLDFLKQNYPTVERPLLVKDFLTDGKHLLVRGLLPDEAEQGGKLTNLNVYGQVEMEKILEAHLSLIVRDNSDDSPLVLFPKNGNHVVSITAGLLSGRPVIDKTRIPTALIAQRFIAGELEDELALDYNLSKDQIEAALQFENIAKAA